MTVTNSNTFNTRRHTPSTATVALAVAATLVCGMVPLLPTATAFSSVTVPSSTSSRLMPLSIATTSPNTDQEDFAASKLVVPSSNKKEMVVAWDVQPVISRVWELDTRPIVMFDGDCNLCSGSVNMLLDFDTSDHFRFCSLSSNFGKSLLVAHGLDPEKDCNSIMVILPNDKKSEPQSRYLRKSEAVLEIASHLGSVPDWVRFAIQVGKSPVAPKAAQDWFLKLVADNRYRMSHLLDGYDQCRLDFDGEYEGRFLNDWEHEELFVVAEDND